MLECALRVGAGGAVLFEASPAGLSRIVLAGEVRPGDEPRAAEGAATPAGAALLAWFSGDPAPLLALDPDPRVFEAAPPFYAAVWREAMSVPWGRTTTYGRLAAAIGKRCARAVGRALGANPLPLLVPCHRVVRADGSEGGFSAGPGWKSFLLELERTRTPERSRI